MVSFTGSTRAGILVAKAAADTVKRVAQELGGKSPNIILDDADLESAVTSGVLQCFSNTGQSCNSPTRMLVPANKMDEAAAIARYMETSEDLFLDWFVRWIDDKLALVDGPEEHCIFLEDGKCTVYPVRPKQCRTYPFWPEILISKDKWNNEVMRCEGINQGDVVDTEHVEQQKQLTVNAEIIIND